MSGIPIIGRSGVPTFVDDAGSLRTTQRPHNPEKPSIGYFFAGERGTGTYKNFAASGSLGALAAGSEVWQFRYGSLPSGAFSAQTNMVISKLQVGIMVPTAATGAALLALSVFFSRSYTVAGSGGTAQLVGTLNNSKLGIDMGRPASTIAIANTTAMTAGTQTLDATPLSSIAFGVGTGAVTTQLASQLLTLDSGRLLDDTPNALIYPVVVSVNEGLVIKTGANAFPAGIAWNLAVRVTWSESAVY